MPHSLALPALAALVLVGGASGLYLGNSAIAEIDPAYMHSPEAESRFYADMVPGGATLDDQPRPLRDASLEQGLGSGCVGCVTYPEEYVPDHHPSVDGFIGAYAAYSPPTAEEIVNEVDAMLAEAARAHFEEVERYAYYPVRAGEEVEAPVRMAVREVASQGAAEVDCLIETQCAGKPTPGI